MEDINHKNWTETVEDFVNDGEIDKAISLLETVVLKLEEDKNQNNFLELSAALLDLSKLYSTKGFSLKADHASSRALLIKQSKSPKGESYEQVPGAQVSHDENSACLKISDQGVNDISPHLRTEASTCEGTSDDDWEAVADLDPGELLSPHVLPGISELSIEDPGTKSSKRRGRGTFSYKSQVLYSDQQSDGPIYDEPEESSVSHTSEGNTQIRNLEYGTRHVLVLDDFPPSTKTIDLEKLVADFKDRGVIIRWVTDTVALAVFKSPSLALEASKSIKCPFTVRILEESDELINSVPPRDLEPPRPRPKTSARTAQRLIAHSMGIKLPSTFGSKELREQEEARKNRIISRQHMRDDAWGDD